MLIASVLLLAVVDSINPSAIVVTLYLLSTSGARAVVQVGTYVAAIFVTYLLLGVAMILGLESLLPSLGRLLDGTTGLILQSLAGLLLLAYSLTASDGSPSAPVARPSVTTTAALLALGVTVTAMELPTAVPYLAAVALITEAGLPMRAWAPLLAVYDVIFVLPPIALLLGHLVLRQRLAQSYAALGRKLESGARETMLWVAGLVGGGLLVTGVIDLAARLR